MGQSKSPALLYGIIKVTWNAISRKLLCGTIKRGMLYRTIYITCNIMWDN